jgi:hypothetical protein
MKHITQKDIDNLTSKIDKLSYYLLLMKEEYAEAKYTTL